MGGMISFINAGAIYDHYLFRYFLAVFSPSFSSMIPVTHMLDHLILPSNIVYWFPVYFFIHISLLSHLLTPSITDLY